MDATLETPPMMTSSDHRNPDAPRPSGEHWRELTAVLPERTVEQFADWLDNRLAVLEAEQVKYVTRQSLSKSLRR